MPTPRPRLISALRRSLLRLGQALAPHPDIPTGGAPAEAPWQDGRWQANRPVIAELLALASLTLATSGAGGDPHAAAIYFAAGEPLCLYFLSAEDSCHSLDLAANPRAAAAIQPAVDDWRAIRGLQFHGRVEELGPGRELDQAWQLYAAKFPFVNGLRAVVSANRWYAFRPGWVRLVDNRQGFGYKQEWTIAAPPLD